LEYHIYDLQAFLCEAREQGATTTMSASAISISSAEYTTFLLQVSSISFIKSIVQAL